MNRKEINRMRLLAGLPLLENKTPLNEEGAEQLLPISIIKQAAKNAVGSSSRLRFEPYIDAGITIDMVGPGYVAFVIGAYTDGASISLAVPDVWGQEALEESAEDVTKVIAEIFRAAKSYFKMPSAKGRLYIEKDETGAWAEIAKKAGLRYNPNFKEQWLF